jgi:TetR/AcrR family transcriptional regulator, cholesterol catabolism regulator
MSSKKAPAGPEPSPEWTSRRREILKAAAEVFFVQGFERGTTKEIAHKVGMSQPNLYHYVGSKQDLMNEIALQVAQDFIDALNASLKSTADPAEQLNRLIDGFVATLLEDQRIFAVYWKEYRALPKDVAHKVLAEERRYIARVEEVVTRAQKEGVLPSDRPAHLVSEGILGMMSWTYWWYHPGQYTAAEISGCYRAMLGLT